jgi:hypothetical protein
VTLCKQSTSRAGVLAFAVSVAVACGGDDAVRTEGSASATASTTGIDTGSSSVTLTTSVSVGDTGPTDSSATADDSTDDGSTGSDTDGATDTGLDETGDPPVAREGQTATQLVSAGTQASSSSYSVVFTIGQPSKLQSTHDSTNYRLQGGLIGANGSPP